MAQARAQAPAKDRTGGSKCKCGCGATVTAQYRPGHDAKHAGQLRRAVADGKLTREAALKIASDTSPAFTSKVIRSLDSLVREQEREAGGEAGK